MRNLAKIEEPEVLENNASKWLAEYLADKSNSTKKYRYRHKDIKNALKEETGHKCVYCESKIGHNTPGDIEHKIPSSKQPSLHFYWKNLTIACTECNRRKNDYYKEGEEFLDPYLDLVEEQIEHHGPLVLWKTNCNRAEITVKILELNTHSRMDLIMRKIGVINDFTSLLERYLSEPHGPLKKLLWKEVEAKTDKKSEYSAMLTSMLSVKGVANGQTQTR